MSSKAESLHPTALIINPADSTEHLFVKDFGPPFHHLAKNEARWLEYIQTVTEMLDLPLITPKFRWLEQHNDTIKLAEDVIEFEPVDDVELIMRGLSIIHETDRPSWAIPETPDYFGKLHFFRQQDVVVADELEDLLGFTPRKASSGLSVSHGDFKPLNLGVHASGKLVVLDWEFAAIADPSRDLAKYTIDLVDLGHKPAETLGIVCNAYKMASEHSADSLETARIDRVRGFCVAQYVDIAHESLRHDPSNDAMRNFVVRHLTKAAERYC